MRSILLLLFLILVGSVAAQTLSIKGSHTLAICSDSTVWAWGGNGYGYLGDSTLNTSFEPVPTRDTNGLGQLHRIVSVTTASGTSLALREDGSLWSWGANAQGQLGIGSTVNQRTPVKVHGPNNVGYLNQVTAICGNYESVFALKSNGTVFGWGWNGTGVLGDGTYFNSRTTPVQVTETTDGFLDSIAAISSGSEHAAALQSNGEVWAWGWDYSGELGTGTGNTSFSAVHVLNSGGTANFTNAIAVACGYNFSVVLRNDGTVWTFGNNEFGQLGDGTYLSSLLPVQVKDTAGNNPLRHIAAIAAGEDHVLALDSAGRIFTWGSNKNGQLGDPFTGKKSNRPMRLASLSGARFITAGGRNSAAKLQDGSIHIWGDNWTGLLGNGTTSSYFALPQPVIGTNAQGLHQNVKQISIGFDHEISLMQNGSVYSWGDLSTNDLPPATLTPNPFPLQVRDSSGTLFLSNIKQIAAGENHNVAITNNGYAYGWGFNNNNQLGAYAISNTAKPSAFKYYSGALVNNIRAGAASSTHTALLKNDSTIIFYGSFTGYATSYYGNNFLDSTGTQPLGHIRAIAAGSNTMAAISADSTIWAWGVNNLNQLGDGTSTNNGFPVHVMNNAGSGPLTGVKSISSKMSHAMALMSDSTVFAWGYNSIGQLGCGDQVQHLLPQQVVDSTGLQAMHNVVAIAVGNYHSLALMADSTVWAWGSNVRGQLGNGTTTSSLLPVHVKNQFGTDILRHVIGISAGELCSGFLMSDGTTMTTGLNDNGQSGAMPTLGVSTPQLPHLSCASAIPQAGYLASDTSGCGSLCVQFNDTSNHYPESRVWLFPGGTPSSSYTAQTTVCYNTPGTYDVILKSTNFMGTDSIFHAGAIVVHPQAVANAGNDTTVCAGLAFPLMGSGGNTYQWTPATGLFCANCASTSANLANTENLVLLIRDVNGCSDTDTLHVTVNPLPNATFTYAVTNNSIQVNSTSSNASSLEWAFGDGTSSTLNTSSHTFAIAAVYTICLTAYNSCGIDTQCVTINLLTSTASKAMQAVDLKVLPTPASERIRIVGLTEEATLEVNDLLGRITKKIRVYPEQEIAIDLPSGIYVGHIITATDMINTEKIIIIH